MPLRTHNGKLLVNKFRLVKSRKDECCCDTGVTCCPGVCVQPCCRTIVRITPTAECAVNAGYCEGYDQNGLYRTYPANSAADCECYTDPYYNYEVCDTYNVVPQPIDIDITDSFGSTTESGDDGDLCFAYFSFPGGSNPVKTFYFTNAVDNKWTTLGNWYRDPELKFPAGELPSATSKVTVYGTIEVPAAVRMANTAAVFRVNELNLQNSSSVNAGEIETKKFNVIGGGSINAGATVKVTQAINAENLAISGTLHLTETATSANFSGNTVIANNAQLINDGVGNIRLLDESENNGEIIVTTATKTIFRNAAKNNGIINGGLVVFIGSEVENTTNGVITPQDTDGQSAEVRFIGSAANNGVVNGTAAFSSVLEYRKLDTETNTYIPAKNNGTVSKKASFYEGAENHGSVLGNAVFTHGENYGTVESAVFFTTIAITSLGPAGGKSRNYGRVNTTAIFRGTSDPDIQEGAVNQSSGCVGQWAWFDSKSVNLGRPNVDNSPTTGGGRLYECDVADCCSEENNGGSSQGSIQNIMQLPRMAFTETETPPTDITDSFTQAEVESNACEEGLAQCNMQFEVSGNCRHIRDCHYTNSGQDACGVNCFYTLKIFVGNNENGPVYNYLYTANTAPLICYGIQSIAVVQECDEGYQNNDAPGGQCRENLTSDQCVIKGSYSYTYSDGTRPMCAAQPCDICCSTGANALVSGPEFCQQIGTSQLCDYTECVQVTAAYCTQCEKVCIDGEGNERAVNSSEECNSCYGYDDHGETDPNCVSEFFTQRGLCGKIIPGTDGVMQELDLCTASFTKRSHRCDFETDFPMVLCAEGSFISHFSPNTNGKKAMPNRVYLNCVDQFTSTCSETYGWGYSFGFQINQILKLSPDGCGGWVFAAGQFPSYGPCATQVAINGAAPATPCGVCYPESIPVTGTVRTCEYDANTNSYVYTTTAVDEDVGITEGYRCATYGSYNFLASCIPCDDLNVMEDGTRLTDGNGNPYYVDAPRGYVPAQMPITMAQEQAIMQISESSSESIDTPPADWAAPAEKELTDDEVPEQLKPVLQQFRAKNPDKNIIVRKLITGRYVFVHKQSGSSTAPPKEKIQAAAGPDVNKCKYDVNDPTGAGTYLSRMLEKIGIRSSPNCSCKARARLMNCRGPEWCANNITMIVGWLREEATKRKLPFVDLAGKLLIKRAIGLSRAAKKKEAAHDSAAPHSSDS